MHCLKCGKEVSLRRFFCEDCQENMEQHPVPPGTPVLIVPRAEPRIDREPRRKRKGYADTVRSLRKVIRNLCIALGAALLTIAILAACLAYNHKKQAERDLIGKNYTTVEAHFRP